MGVGDIGVIAEAIEKCIPEIAKNNGGEDIRHRLKINIAVSKSELNAINEDLQELVNHKHSSEEETDVETVELDLVGIDFVISLTEDTPLL